MSEIKQLISSPVFWFASVVIAFLMSFFAGYAKEWTDKWFEKRSKKKDEEAKARQKDFERKLEKLKANPYLLSLYQSNIIYQKMRQILYLIVSYVFLALALYSATNLNFISATVMFLSCIFIFLSSGKSVGKILDDLRSVVNAALDDDDRHFVG